jgi:hypothetical protein
MTAALLGAVCLPTFAGSTDEVDSTSGYMEAVERSSSHSMHPSAPVNDEHFADDEEVQQQSQDQ